MDPLAMVAGFVVGIGGALLVLEHARRSQRQQRWEDELLTLNRRYAEILTAHTDPVAPDHWLGGAEIKSGDVITRVEVYVTRRTDA